MKVIYEPHPINPARKAKLQAQGYKIIDAIFAPPGTPLHEKLEVEGEEETAPTPEPIVADEVQEVVEEAEAAAEPTEEEGEVEADDVSGDEEPRKRGRPRKE